MIYRTLRLLLNGPIRRFWLKRVTGLEHVPRSGGVILASNHESYLDFLLVPVSGCRLPCYMVGEVFYRMPLVGGLFRAMNFIPVDRRARRNRLAVRTALERLEAGGVVGIFPEGTRSPDGRLQRARHGAAYLAHLTEAPVVPVAVLGTHEAWPKDRRWPRAGACEVRFGEPLRFQRADFERDRGVLDESLRTIMHRIAALAEEEYRW